MDVLITGIALALSMQFAKEKKFMLKEFIINVVIFSALTYVINLVLNYLNSKFHFSIPFLNNVPIKYNVWFGASLFFIVCCAFSIMGWRQLNNQKRIDSK